MPINLRETLDFLRDLQANNNRQWFEQNRKRYDTARAHFEALVSDLIVDFSEVENLTGVIAKDCIFRINRDIRFSPDKTPYKTNLGAVIGQGGRKPIGRSYYVQIAPDGHSFIAGGMHSPSREELDKVRRHLAEDATQFKKIIRKPAFIQYFGQIQGEQLKTVPQGYPKDHPDIALLRFKQYLATYPLSDAQVVESDLSARIVEVLKTLKPFVTYLETAKNA